MPAGINAYYVNVSYRWSVLICHISQWPPPKSVTISGSFCAPATAHLYLIPLCRIFPWDVASWNLAVLLLLLNKRKWSESESHSVVSDYLWPHGLYSPRNSPGQNTGVHSLSLLQGIFPTQGSNPSHSHCRQIFYQLSHILLPCILVRWMKLEPIIQSEVS